MAIKKTANTIKSLFREIEAVKAHLAKELRRIDADDLYSENYKAQQRAKAKAAATGLLDAIMSRAEISLAELRKESKEPASFDYTNPKLAAAIDLIRAAGKTLPEAAAKQIISDFKGKPAELKYLMTLFEESGMTVYAVDAAEAANEETSNASFPNRLDDILYYSTTGDPTAEVDFSGIESEMDTFTASFGEAADSE